MTRLRPLLAALLLAATTLAAEEPGAMALALAAAETGDWTTAQAAAGRSGPVAQALIDWQSLRAGHGDLGAAARFLATHSDWPGLDPIRRRALAALTSTTDAATLHAVLGDTLPATLAAEEALLATLAPEAAAHERARFWTEVPLSAPEAADFLKRHPDLAPLTPTRIATLLDAQAIDAAEASLPLMPAADRGLMQARIAVQAGRSGADMLVAALPPELRDEPGLMLDRYLSLVRDKQFAAARDLMLAQGDMIRRPDLWAPRRVDWARAALRSGDWALAEKLAANHYLTEGDPRYPDLEWLAGYAALRAGAADRALAHFRHLETQVGSAISRARAFYWQGRALEGMGNAAEARAAHQQAAAQPGTYYGQLSAERIGVTMPPAFAATGRAETTLPDWRGSALRADPRFQAALWLIATNRRDEAQPFLLRIAQDAAPDDIARMARLMLEANAPWHALRLSKQAANKGAIYPAAHFPITPLADKDHGAVPVELVLSIARQESEFNHTVTSHAGARGLMQVMPDTARQMARVIREPYEEARLTQDAGYNARLGAAYLKGLRDRFGASVALVAAGYNAGPGRSARWLREAGDLRRHADAVDWVEMIPFDETRNYVMRVAEAQPIYRARLSGKPAPIVPTFDLTGGGLMPPPPLRLTLAMSKPPVPKPYRPPVLPLGVASAPWPGDTPPPAWALEALLPAEQAFRALGLMPRLGRPPDDPPAP